MVLNEKIKPFLVLICLFNENNRLSFLTCAGSYKKMVVRKIYGPYKRAVWEKLSLNLIRKILKCFLMCLIFGLLKAFMCLFRCLNLRILLCIFFSSKALMCYVFNFLKINGFMCLIGYVLIKNWVYLLRKNLNQQVHALIKNNN